MYVYDADADIRETFPLKFDNLVNCLAFRGFSFSFLSLLLFHFLWMTNYRKICLENQFI